ncbi:MAG: dihydroorotase [Planctomycetaceae bacterium]|nr:MAG: dihydroorotase [Planctomycetaceae bacterium]
MPRLLLQGGRVIDPARGWDAQADVLIDEGRIIEIGSHLGPVDKVLDCRGLIVSPGWIDLHVATRDPGFEEDETTDTVTAAALAGGFTTIAALPDTQPVVDNRASVEYVTLQAERARHCRVLPLGAVTRDHAGQELADLGQLADGGAVAFTDAKTPLQSAEIMRRALEYARMFGRGIFTHPQDAALTTGGVMHEGYYSTVLGLRGMPAAAEQIMVTRDVALAELTGGHVHLMCVTTQQAVEVIRAAKRRRLAVTADVAVHHLLLSDADVQSYDPHYKVNPPFRSEEHIAALISGLKDGTLDALCSDHQPLAAEKTSREFDQAPFGIVGLETVLPLAVRALIEPGHLSWCELISKLTVGPARVLGMPHLGTLAPGVPADITIIHPTQEWTIDPTKFYSKSRNTPFAGWRVRGRIYHVLVAGEHRYSCETGIQPEP